MLLHMLRGRGASLYSVCLLPINPKEEKGAGLMDLELGAKPNPGEKF
jgi:hypothetical protein